MTKRRELAIACLGLLIVVDLFDPIEDFCGLDRSVTNSVNHNALYEN